MTKSERVFSVSKDYYSAQFPLPVLSMGEQQQFVNITAYETELVNIITVPAHYSLDEIYEAVWAEMKKLAHAPNRDHSSIFIAPGEFLRDFLLPQS